MSKSLGIKFGMVALVAVLAACQSNKKIVGQPVANGSWASGDGVYVAEFFNGRFRTIANDNGSVISQGSYIAFSKQKLQLTWTSNITGETNQAECLKPELNVMNCTDSQGRTFTLRRAAT